MPINWTKGLFRTWIVGSLAWIGLVGYTAYVDCGWYKPGGGQVCFTDLIPIGLDSRLLWLALPPLAIFIIGLGVLWCHRGFRSSIGPP